MRVVFLALICVSVFVVSAGQSVFAAAFGPVTVYPAGQGPSFATAADLNGDGITDLIVLNKTSNNLSVLMGNADGTYQSPVNYAVGLAPVAMTLEYFDQDWNVDIAVANGGSNDISVLLGNSDGTFRPAVQYSVGSGINPAGIVWTTFTASGNLDLAVANSSGGTSNRGNVAIFLGNGDGTFQAARNYDTLGVRPVALATAPLDTGGNPDLALANFASNSVSILLGDGKGGFTAGGDYPVGTGPTSIAVFPVSFPLLLAVANSTDNSITILFNSNGTFSRSKSYPFGASPVSIWSALINLGGLYDIATANTNDTVSIFLGNRGVPLLHKPSMVPTCSSPKSVVSFDINFDHKNDLILACSDGVGVMLGQ